MYFNKREMTVKIYDDPSWEYHIIDELEQFQIFHKRIIYDNLYILERIGINYDDNIVLYKINE